MGAALVHLSTDVVFDGDAAPYGEYDPLSRSMTYGRAKAVAEQVVTERVPGCLHHADLAGRGA